MHVCVLVWLWCLYACIAVFRCVLFCLCSGLTLAFLLSLTIVGQALTPSTYITPADRERFRRIFLTSAADDLESLYYSVLGISLLGDVPSEQQA